VSCVATNGALDLKDTVFRVNYWPSELYAWTDLASWSRRDSTVSWSDDDCASSSSQCAGCLGRCDGLGCDGLVVSWSSQCGLWAREVLSRRRSSRTSRQSRCLSAPSDDSASTSSRCHCQTQTNDSYRTGSAKTTVTPFNYVHVMQTPHSVNRALVSACRVYCGRIV